MFKAQNGSKDIVKFFNCHFYEATTIIFVRKENLNNRSQQFLPCRSLTRLQKFAAGKFFFFFWKKSLMLNKAAFIW